MLFLDIAKGSPSYRDTVRVSLGRVICVAFCRSTAQHGVTPNVLTVSDDRRLRIWDVPTKSVVRETEAHGDVVDADWRGSLSTSVIFGGEKSVLLVWDFAQSSISTIQTYSSNSLVILRSHPQNPDLAALGYKNGLVIVQGLKKGNNAVYKLKGHTEEVLSLSWSLSPGLQLASTALDRTLRIWDVETEKGCHTLKVPTSSKNRKVDSGQKGRQWVAATWIPSSPGVIVCSTISGDICLYDTNFPQGGWSFLDIDDDSAGHFRCVFNLSVVSTRDKTFVVSTSLDRNIVFWDVATNKSAFCIPSFGGFPYSLSFSPIACATIAIGCGDSTIKLWRTDSVRNPFSCTVYWQGIRGRVMTVAWHPKKEDIIAFGTDDGKVGAVNTSTKQTLVSVSQHKQTVYVVSWATFPDLQSDDKAEQTFLLSCGDGKVKVHHFPRLDKEALDLNTAFFKETPTRAKFIAVNFNKDLSFLTLGDADGSVHIYNARTLNKVALIESQRKAVENMLWHPSHTISSLQNSPLKYMLACSSLEGPVHLYDLRELAEVKSEMLRLNQSTSQLIGHSAKVVSLSWSPFREGYLASASYDGTVQVWDVMQSRPVANFRGHSGRVISCCWSPVDPDVIYSGGEDCTVKCWEVSKQKDMLAPSKTEKQKLKSDTPLKPADEVPHAVPENETDGEIFNSRSTVSERHDSSGKPLQPKSGHATGSKKKKAVKSFFPVFSAQENKPKESAADDCMLLADKLAEKHNSLFVDPNRHLNMYLSTDGILAVTDAEIAQHKKDLNFDQAFQMMAWKGDLAEALHEAAATRKLNDTLVALAPAISRTLWLEMCEKYAEQLVSDGLHHQAALYLLTCHKVSEAVKLLCNNGCTREALVIAKSHLVEGDPEAAEVYITWAERAKSVGNYEQAARCYMALDDARNAVRALQNRKDARTKRAAAYIAKIFGLLAEADAVFVDAMQSALVQKDWEIAVRLIEEQERPKAFFCLIEMHKCLTEALEAVKAASGSSADGSGDDRQWSDALIRGGHKSLSADFVQKIREVWSRQGVSLLASQHAADVEALLKTSCNSSTQPEAVFRVAVWLTVALLEGKSYDLNVARALSYSLLFNIDFFNQLSSLLYCTTVAGEDPDFPDKAVIILDSLMEGEAATDFQCPPSVTKLFDELHKVKGQDGTQASIGREIVGLLYCMGVLQVLQKIFPDPTVLSVILKRLEPLICSPALACMEHLMKKLRRKQELLMQERVKAARKSPQSAGEVSQVDEDCVVVLSLEKECELLRSDLQNITFNCSFPDMTALIDSLLGMWKFCDDENSGTFRDKLTAWKRLILDDECVSGDA